MPPIRVVLGEDHALVRDGTRRILEQHLDLQVVGEAGDGSEVLELLQRLQPDVAILDIRMPPRGGIEVLEHLGELAPNTKAIVLTAYDDDAYIGAALRAGAAGYLLKTARAEELVDAVRRVLRGELVIHPAVAVKMAQVWRRREATAARPLSPEVLTPREREVLVLAARALRNSEIAEQLGISVRTVEGHVNNILSKLGCASRMEAVLYAVTHDWVSLDPSGETAAWIPD